MNRPESWSVGVHASDKHLEMNYVCIRVSEQDARQLLEGLDSLDNSEIKAWLRGELERHLLSVQQGNDR